MIAMDLFPEATFVDITGSASFMRSSADHALTRKSLFVQERVLSRQLEFLERFSGSSVLAGNPRSLKSKRRTRQ
jgi:hypothetical protein